MSATDARTWLHRLEAERLDAIDAGLGENAVYMAELQSDLAASRVAYRKDRADGLERHRPPP
jgi:hypothetical protein